jgi:hypothetical protein
MKPSTADSIRCVGKIVVFWWPPSPCPLPFENQLDLQLPVTKDYFFPPESCGDYQLSFQRKVVQDFHSRKAVTNNPPASSTGANRPAPLLSQRRVDSQNIGSDVEDVIFDQPVPRMSCFCNDYVLVFNALFITKKKRTTATSKRTTSVTVYVDMSDAEENIHANGMIFRIAKVYVDKLKCILVLF